MIEPKYNAAWAFTEGVAPVMKGKRYLLIDPASEVLFEKAAAIGQCRSRTHPLPGEEYMVVLGPDRGDGLRGCRVARASAAEGHDIQKRSKPVVVIAD